MSTDKQSVFTIKGPSFSHKCMSVAIIIMAENTIKKLEDQLNCAICLDTYTDPKLLHCFHIYCRQCLVKLVVKDQQGQLSLTCPSCRQVTPVPANGVVGLQSAFQVTPLLEILDDHKKAKDTAVSKEVVKTDMPQPIPSKKKIIINCFEHKDKERELYCETCEDLICYECAIKGGKHQNHNHYVLDRAFERYKGEIAPSLEPMEGKLVAVKEALAQLDKRCGEISVQREAIGTNIHSTIGRLHEVLDIRETELISQLDQITQGKLKELAVQRDQIETIQAQLSSCLDFIKESLKTDNQGEVLMMKTNIVKQVKELTTPLQPDISEPIAEADMKFIAPQDMTNKCQNYGQVFFAQSPDPLKFQATGKGLEEAVVGEKSTAVLLAFNFEGEPLMKSINSFQCELMSEMTSVTERGNIKHNELNNYEISYQPTIKGKHQLSIEITGVHIQGSPFSIVAKLPLEKLGTPILTVDCSEMGEPIGVALNRRGEVVVVEHVTHRISIFSPNGERIRSFDTCTVWPKQLSTPWGVAVDGEGNILVADSDNDSIQKFTENGDLLTIVGKIGKQSLQFSAPHFIGFNVINNKVYVADSFNHRIQILNSDLAYQSAFGKEGSGKGQFKCVHGIGFDTTGNVYVADCNNHRIQVFTAGGRFLRMFGRRGDGRGQLSYPKDIAIDTNDVVYVSEGYPNCRISVFTSKGQFVISFGQEGSEPGEFNDPGPHGIAVDSNGLVYVCDSSNSRIQVF